MNFQSSVFKAAEHHGGLRSEYFPAFDYLRIILATVVAASHVNLFEWKFSGHLSVQIFFALSGWLIGGILLQSKKEDLPRFYFNRAARIWIPYLTAIALLVGASLLRDHITPKWVEFIFYKLTFVYDFFGPSQIAAHVVEMPLGGSGNHFWSISAEEQFYLLAPLLIVLLPMGRSPWLWIAIFLATMLTPLWDFFSAISLGVLAVVSRQYLGRWNESPMVAAFLIVLAAALLILIVVGIAPYRIAAPILAASLVLGLAQPGRPSRTAAFLGGVSYPMYLNHWIGAFVAHGIVKRLGAQSQTSAAILAVFLGLVVAAFLYVTIDLTVKRNRDYFYTQRLGFSLAIVGCGLVLTGLFVGLALTS